MKRVFAIALVGSALHVNAQVAPSARLDTNVIRIGEQARLTLSVPMPEGQASEVTWPEIGDTLPQRIVVVANGEVATRASGSGPALRERTLTITSFDSGVWAIEPLRFTIDGDTVATEALVLTVNTVQVDTAQAFRDIKDIEEVPFSLLDWLRANWPWVAGGTAVAAALITGVLIWRRRRNAPKPTPPRPEVPLHERVLAALTAIDDRMLWQQGHQKQYHTEVTDVLRAYVEERFGTPAMEKTTDELLGELRTSAMIAAHREQLGNILRLADLVKFAKLTPVPAENEQLMSSAIALVRNTAEAIAEPRPPHAR